MLCYLSCFLVSLVVSLFARARRSYWCEKIVSPQQCYRKIQASVDNLLKAINRFLWETLRADKHNPQKTYSLHHHYCLHVYYLSDMQTTYLTKVNMEKSKYDFSSILEKRVWKNDWILHNFRTWAATFLYLQTANHKKSWLIKGMDLDGWRKGETRNSKLINGKEEWERKRTEGGKNLVWSFSARGHDGNLVLWVLCCFLATSSSKVLF